MKTKKTKMTPTPKITTLVSVVFLLAGCSTPSFLNQFLHPADMAADAWWKTSTKLPDARQETAAAALGGKLFVVGGIDASSTALTTVEVYDPSSKKWSPAAALPEPLYSINLATVGGKLFVVGALSAGDVAVGRGYSYDPAADQWTLIAAMPSGSERGAAMVASVDSVIYLAGGLRGGVAVGDFAAYDTVADSWSTLPALPLPVDHGVGAVVGGVFFAVAASSLQSFDFTLAVWSPKTSMPTARHDAAIAVSNETIIVAGGEDDDGPVGATERYQPALDRWSLLAPMPTPRHGMGAAVVNGLIYVPGGADASGVHPVTVMESLQP